MPIHTPMEGRGEIWEYWPWLVALLLAAGLIALAVNKANAGDPALSGPGRGGQESLVKAATRHAVDSETPADCKAYFVPEKVAGCAETVQPGKASVTIGAARVRGDRAWVEMQSTEIPAVHSTARLAHTDRWRLIDARTHLNWRNYPADFRRYVMRESELTPSEARCSVRRVLALGRHVLESAYAGPGKMSPVTRATISCYSPARLERLVPSTIRQHLIDAGASPQAAQCISEQATLSVPPSKRARLLTDPKLIARVRDEALSNCRRTIEVSNSGGPHYEPETSTAGDISEQARGFADAVDRICAVNFNQAMYAQNQLYALADSSGWSERKTEGTVHLSWARWQHRTYLMTGRLGTPPFRPGLVRRWRANVGERAELFKGESDAWFAGNPNKAGRLTSIQDRLKARADVMGRNFGLRICTSN